ncbi:hypothetical protein ACKS0A_02282 [Histoplasma ohiense]
MTPFEIYQYSQMVKKLMTKKSLTTHAGEGLPQGMIANGNLLLKSELTNKACAVWTQVTAAMSFVDNKLSVSVGENLFSGLKKFFKRANVPVHAVDRLDRNEDRASAVADLRLGIANRYQSIGERFHIIVPKRFLAKSHTMLEAIESTCVHELVVHNGISRKRYGLEDDIIGNSRRGDDQGSFGTVKSSYLILNRLNVL